MLLALTATQNANYVKWTPIRPGPIPFRLIDEPLFVHHQVNTRFYCKRHISICLCVSFVCASASNYDYIKPEDEKRINKIKIQIKFEIITVNCCQVNGTLELDRCTIAIPLGDRWYECVRCDQSNGRIGLCHKQKERNWERDRQLSIVIVWWCAGDLARFLWDFAVLYIHTYMSEMTLCSLCVYWKRYTMASLCVWVLKLCESACLSIRLWYPDWKDGACDWIAAIEHTPMFLQCDSAVESLCLTSHRNRYTMDNGNKQA